MCHVPCLFDYRMSVCAYHASAVPVVKGKLCVFGGELSDGSRTNQVEVYSPASNSWARAADVPFALDQLTAVARSECTHSGLVAYNFST